MDSLPLKAFIATLKSEAVHFIVPIDESETVTDWLERHDIAHSSSDIYLIDTNDGAIGCCVVSITDELQAVHFRLWANETVTGPI